MDNMGQEGRQETVALLREHLDSVVISNSDNGGGSYGRGGDGGDDDNQLTALLICCFVVSACGAFTFGLANAYTSPTESAIIADLGLTVAEFSTFGSILTIGGLVGAIISGKMADLLGRKYMTCILAVIYIVGFLITAFAKSVWMLDLGRLITGFGTGIGAYLVPVYFAELAPQKLRGTLMTLAMLTTACGVVFVYLIGSFVNWRTLALLGIIPCLLDCCLLFFIPESPRWLAKTGRIKECQEALIRLRGRNANISEEATEIEEYTNALAQISGGGISDLCQRNNRYPLIVAIGLVLIQQLGGLTAYAFYMEAIFISAGISRIVGFAAVSAAQILGGVVGVILVDKFGRQPLLLGSAAGTFAGSFLTGLSFIVKDIHLWEHFAPVLTLISVLVFVSSFGIGIGGLPWIIISEILPINIKGLAGSIANFICSLCAWLVSYSFVFFLHKSPSGTFFMFAVINGLGVIFAAKMVPETKGRTLEEIQASFTFRRE